MPGGFEAVVFGSRHLDEKRIGGAIKPGNEGFHFAQGHGGAAAGGFSRGAPNVKENTGTGGGLGRDVLINKQAKAIFVAANQHFFRAVPIRMGNIGAIDDLVVIGGIGVIDAFE